MENINMPPIIRVAVLSLEEEYPYVYLGNSTVSRIRIEFEHINIGHDAGDLAKFLDGLTDAIDTSKGNAVYLTYKIVDNNKRAD